jgi:hypothetical protein
MRGKRRKLSLAREFISEVLTGLATGTDATGVRPEKNFNYK